LTGKRAVNPFLAGAAGRCPNCAKGPLFAGFLSVTKVCPVCGFDLGASDSGDGPAVFVILIVGFVMVFGVLITEIAVNPPVWALLVGSIPLAGLLCLILLRPMKGLMIAAQIRNRAAQHRSDAAP
jgi:uncharacterized protein (DUF983 family)